jgi:hypothetical protein
LSGKCNIAAFPRFTGEIAALNPLKKLRYGNSGLFGYPHHCLDGHDFLPALDLTDAFRIQVNFLRQRCPGETRRFPAAASTGHPA